MRDNKTSGPVFGKFFSSARPSRRDFLARCAEALGAAMAAQVLPGAARRAAAIGPRSKFVVSQLKYAGGNWDPHPAAALALARFMAAYTSVDVEPNRNVITLDAKDLFEFPFLYMAGDGAFSPFSRKHSDRLKSHLLQGGFLLIDNCSGKAAGGFDSSVRGLAEAMFGKDALKKLPTDHTVYQTFWLIRDAWGGAKILRRYLEGVEADRLTPLVYSSNNLGAGWVRRYNQEADASLGGADLSWIAGEDAEQAKRYGINLVMYALCADYKKDAVHVNAILERIKARK